MFYELHEELVKSHELVWYGKTPENTLLQFDIAKYILGDRGVVENNQGTSNYQESQGLQTPKDARYTL